MARLTRLTKRQERAAKYGDDVTLTDEQIAVLQRHGLVADAGHWYYSPTGGFALAPASPARKRRRRVTLQPVTSVDCNAA